MSDTTFNFDAKATALLESFGKDGSASGLCFAEARDKNKRAVRFNITCESGGDLLVSDYGHSVLCKLVSTEDLAVVESVEDAAIALLPEGIEFKPFIKDEKFFMKLLIRTTSTEQLSIQPLYQANLKKLLSTKGQKFKLKLLFRSGSISITAKQVCF